MIRLADLHIARTALRTIGLVVAALVALLSLFDFVEQLSLVGQGSYDVVNAFQDMVLTAPSRLLQVAPVSMLLGTLLALGALARAHELTALLSLGISELQIMRTIALLVMPATLLLLTVAEFVVPPAQRLAYVLRTAALDSATQPAERGVWAHDGGHYLNVRQMEGNRRASAIDIYSFAADGQLQSAIHADHADLLSNAQWKLTGVTRTAIESNQFVIDHPASLDWQPFLTRAMLRDLFLPIDSIPPVELYGQIRGAERMHQKVPRLRQAFWNFVRLPVSMLAMAMIVIPFVFGPTRSQTTARNLRRAMGFAIAYSLGQQILDRLGLLLRVHPAITALTPPLLAIGLSLWLFRTRLRLR